MSAPFQLEIDGQAVPFDFIYEDANFGNGAWFGMNEVTKPGDTCHRFKHSDLGAVYGVAVQRRNPDGSYWDIDGLFRRGEWAEAADGTPIYRVWERIA